MGLSESAARALELRPEEQRPFAWMFAGSACTGFTLACFQAASGAELIDRLGAQALPWVYVVGAVVVPLVGVLYGRIAHRLSLVQLVSVNLAFTAFFSLFTAIALQSTTAAWPAFLGAVELELLWALAALQFWGVAARIFDVRQAKRLYGPMGSGEVIASFAAGLAAGPIAARFGTSTLLASAGVGAIASLLIVRRLAQFSPGMNDPATDHEDAPGSAAESANVRGRFVRLVYALVSCSYVAYYVVDNAFFAAAEANTHNPGELAALIGYVTAACGVGALFIRTVVTAPLLARFGLAAGLFALPMSTAAFAAIAIAGSAGGHAWVVVAAIVGLRTVDKMLRESLDRSAMLLLYQPMPATARTRTLNVVEGVVGPAASGIAGLGLAALAHGRGLDVPTLCAVLVPVGLAWIVAVQLVRRAYAGVLAFALDRRRLGDGGPSLVESAETLEVLASALRSDRPGEVLYCLDLLAEARPGQLDDTLLGLLGHAHPEVRHAALARIRERPLTRAAAPVRRLLAVEPDASVKAAAIRALVAIEETEAVDDVLPYLDSPDPVIVTGAIEALIQSGGIEGVLSAGEHLKRLVQSASAQERVLAAHVLGDAGIASFYRPLLALVADPSLAVRRAAATAAGALRQPKLWPSLVKLLDDDDTALAAGAALVAAGAPVAPLLAAALEGAKPGGRVAIVGVLGRIGGPVAIASLRARVGDPAPALRHATIAALVTARDVADKTFTPALRAALEREVRHFARCLEARDHLVDPAFAPCLAALLDEAAISRATVLRLISLLHGPDRVRPAYALLEESERERRALALEVVDHLLAGDPLRVGIVALFDDAAPSDRRAKAPGFAVVPAAARGWLTLVVTTGDPPFLPWTRASALHTLTREPGPDTVAVGEQCANDPEPLVRDAARRAASTRTDYGDEMLLPIEKTLILKGAEIFAGVPGGELSRLAAIAHEHELAPGERLFSKSDPGTSMFVIARGRVRVHDGDVTLDHMGEGQAFGELAALDPAPRLTSITATEPTLLLRIEQEPLLELLDSHPSATRAILRTLCRRFRAATERRLAAPTPKTV